MSLKQETFRTSDNKKLVIFHHEVEEASDRVVLIIHGHGDHGGRYQGVSEFFNSNGIPTAVLTLRGHGISEGKKGHAPSLNQLILDVEYFVRQVRLKYMDAQCYLYGHSMGGNIVLNYLIRDQSSEIAAAIVTSPWIKLAFQPPKFKVVLGNIVADIIPTYTEVSDLDTNEISSIPEEVERYKQDTLNHNKITAKLFQQISQGGENIGQDYSKIKHKVFLAHGDLDKITSFEASKQLAEKHQPINWHPYHNAKHELHNDIVKEALFNDILSWMEGIKKA